MRVQIITVNREFDLSMSNISVDSASDFFHDLLTDQSNTVTALDSEGVTVIISARHVQAVKLYEDDPSA